MENILNCAEDFKSYYSTIRRELHRCPELGFELDKTTAIVMAELERMGISYRKNVGISGIVADIEGKDKDVTIALRADMDALPIEEKNDVEYKSQIKGNMHACGHDAHTAILLGVANILSLYKEELPCNVRFIFQPAEETTGGAKPMIDDGALDKVDAIFGLHVDSGLECGKIGIKYGAMNASSTDIKIEVEGKSCHGAYPSGGVDAIVVMASIITSLQSIVSRNIDARDSAVISLGKISGGTKENIMAQNVVCTGTLRTLSKEVKAKCKQRIAQLIECIAQGYGAIGRATFADGYTALINDDSCVDIVRENAQKLVGEDKIYVKKVPNMGVEDFAYFVEKVPGAFFYLGVRNEKRGIVASEHNDRFDIDEDALPLGVKMGILNIMSAYEKIKKEKQGDTHGKFTK